MSDAIAGTVTIDRVVGKISHQVQQKPAIQRCIQEFLQYHIDTDALTS